MDTVYDFLEQPDDRFVTPESLAWDLVMGDDMDDFTGVMRSFVSDENGSLRADRFQQLADEFQVLITIYMEMVFNVLKTNHMGSLLDDEGEVKDDVDLEEEIRKYKPNFRQYSLDDMTGLFRSKFAKIRYFLSIIDITKYCENEDNDFGTHSKYYCKILLLDDGRSSTYKYFKMATHIPEGKRYTFLGRPDDNPQQKKLDDFYAVVYLPPHINDTSKTPRKVKISFSKYNVITADPHLAY